MQLFLFADDMIIYLENLRKSIKELISNFERSQVQGQYKNQLYFYKKQLESADFKSTIYSSINLRKHKDKLNKNFKNLS